ncbi:AzlC family ABC transporter permease [Modestobacter sp. I12A-02662]|uniref:AzlC family ABC transporter permease n=1 Tax=Modestobacter sp. I12A-02662 TaxID=1730496 RepID=UPI0034DFE511
MTTTLPTPRAAIRVDARGLALRDARTVVPGLLPFGVLLGVTVVTTGASGPAGVLGGPIVYGGSAQLTALTLSDRGLGLVAVVLSAAVVNARLLLYSAALGHRFRAQPALFRWLAPHLIIDQTYLMASSRPELADRDFRRYWVWLGGAVLVVWTGSIALGIGLAPVLPPLPHLTLVGTAMFIGCWCRVWSTGRPWSRPWSAEQWPRRCPGCCPRRGSSPVRCPVSWPRWR